MGRYGGMAGLFSLFIVCLMGLTGGCGKTAGSGISSLSNPFTRVGSALTIDSLVSAVSGSSTSLSTTSQTYYGRAVIKNGSFVYGATFKFSIHKQSDSAAYFSSFQILRLVVLNGMSSAIPVVTSPLTVGVGSGYSLGSNSIAILGALDRTANFNLSFSNHTYLSDVTSAAFVASDDFRTIVGGDNQSFFFIAQKASSLGSVTTAQMEQRFSLVEFHISGFGSLTFADLWTFSSSGVGGNGYSAYRATTATGSVREGEFNLVDATGGLFVFGSDSSPGNGTPTADGAVSGAFLLSPDGQLILGYDLENSLYWAGGI